MCGIFGWDLRPHKSGRGLSRARRIALTIGLTQENDKRGGDAWGVFHPDKEKGDRVVKGLGTAAESWEMISVHSLGSTAGQRVIGHTRKATHGDSTDLQCAHPFVMEGIVGCHNGILDNHKELNKLFGRDFEVDSQHLISHLAEQRGGDDWRKIEGYGTVCWWDEESADRIHLMRFNGGDMSVCSIKGGGIVWSSSKYHLKSALALCGLDVDTIYKTKERFVHFIDEEGYFITEREIPIEDRILSRGWEDAHVISLQSGKGLSRKEKKRRRKEMEVIERQRRDKGYVTLVNGRADIGGQWDEDLERGAFKDACSVMLELRWMAGLLDAELIESGYTDVTQHDVLNELLEFETQWPELEDLTDQDLADGASHGPDILYETLYGVRGVEEISQTNEGGDSEVDGVN